MASIEPDRRVCVYCGGDADTDDHVPPKNLFRSPRPSTLITVPSCTPCNLGKSKDDEYFRMMIAFRHDVDHPDAAAARDSALRSLDRHEASRFRAAFLSAVREVDLRTAAGLYVGRAGAYGIDVDRLDRVVARITAGLFYDETRAATGDPRATGDPAIADRPGRD